MMDMQKHIEGLRRENEILIKSNIVKEGIINKKSKAFIMFNIAYLVTIAPLIILISMLYHANSLLITDNQTKDNWKGSAIELLGKNEDLRMENEYIKHGMEEALRTGFIQKMPPPMVKDIK